MDKKQLRKAFLAQRLAMEHRDWEERSRNICKHLLQFCLSFDEAEQVFIFYGIHNEIPVQNLYESLAKRFRIALPRLVSKGEMEFRKWDLKTQLQTSSFKTKEPSLDSPLVQADGRTIVIVPSLAIDQHLYRLGYGGGFYDKFLEKNPDVLSIGVNFSEFIVEELPREAWDQKLQWVCTEYGIRRGTIEQPL